MDAWHEATRLSSKKKAERERQDQVTNSVLQQKTLRWYEHVLRKEDNDQLKKCMEYEVEGARPRGRLKKTWRKIVEKDCQARKLNREHVMDRIRWMKQIRDD